MSTATSPLLPTRAPLHVLVADDNRSTAETTAELLAATAGWVVDVAYDGGDCLRQVGVRRPDAVLLDLRMPVMGGLEVARRIRALYPANPPYLIAVTGCAEEVEDLPAMDRVFDRTLAKPLDTDELCASLQHLARNGWAGEDSEPSIVDVAEVLVRSVRKVAPLADVRGLDLGYDHLGPSLLVEEDAVRLHRAFDPLWLGLLEVLRGGSVLLRTQAELRPSGTATLTVDAAATGPFAGPRTMDAWLQAMGLPAPAATAAGAPPATGSAALRPPGPLPLRQGRCQRSGATLQCWLDPNEGLLLRATLQYSRATPNEAVGQPEVKQARAWLVGTHAMPMAAEAQRLRRLGWTVTPLEQAEQALAALRDGGAGLAVAPELLVVFAPAGPSVAELQALQQALPPRTRRLAAVPNGHPWLGSPDSLPGWELATTPFSPLDLAGLSQPHLAAQHALAGPTLPADLGPGSRPRVLVVDDSAINRIVGRGLVEMLGYEVDTAHDGLDAIDRCRRRPPACVLMDVDMPVLGGLDATARLRALQRSGELPLFPVIAATASADAEAACRAVGMDAFLTKPLDLQLLRALLRRYTDDVVVR